MYRTYTLMIPCKQNANLFSCLPKGRRCRSYGIGGAETDPRIC